MNQRNANSTAEHGVRVVETWAELTLCGVPVDAEVADVDEML